MTGDPYVGGLGASSGPLCEAYDVGLLDLDGVVYVGQLAVPHAAASLHEAGARGMRFAYVTNNAARTPHAVVQHLRDLGMAADDADVVTSAQAAATMVVTVVEPGSHVLVVGGAGLVEALEERGLVPVRSADDDPAALVQGFSPDVDWKQLAEGALVLARGVPWIASNLDLTIPTPRGKAPGNGALVNVLRQATGREPQVAGKPELPLHAEAVRRSGATRPLVVGDRLDTDIEGAVRARTDSLLVLTGVTSAVEAVLAPQQLRPTYLGADLRALLEPHVRPDGGAGSARCGAWLATIVDGEFRLDASSEAADPLDALRAACCVVWSAGGFTPPARDVDRELVRAGLPGHV